MNDPKRGMPRSEKHRNLFEIFPPAATSVAKIVLAIAISVSVGTSAQAEKKRPQNSGQAQFKPPKAQQNGNGKWNSGRRAEILEDGPAKPPKPPKPDINWGKVAGDFLQELGKVNPPAPAHPPAPIHPQHPIIHIPSPTYYPAPQVVHVQPEYVPLPVYNEVVPASSTVVHPAVVPEVNVVPNPKPAVKPVAAAANKRPDLELAAADSEVQSLAQALVQQQATSDLDALKTNLGQKANDPAVKKALEDMQKKIDNGEPITDADINSLKTVANASKLPLAPGVTANTLATNVGSLVSSSQANAILAAASSAPPGIPGDLGPFVVIPTLPEETVLWLPGGSILLGSGGQGEVSVVETPVEELLGVPVATSEPIPDATPTPSGTTNPGILIQNPADNSGIVKFDVSNQHYTLDSGGEQRLSFGKNAEIVFDRGNGTGQARYSIWDGTYAFSATENGWELYRQTFRVTIDNSKNTNAFNYVVDNVAAVAGPGEIKAHTGDFPIEIRYDRGNGESEATKRIDKSGNDGTVLAVQVSAKDGCWDLYATVARATGGNEVASAKGKSELAKRVLGKKAGSKSARLAAILSSALHKKSDALSWTVAKEPVTEEPNSLSRLLDNISEPKGDGK